MRFELRRRLLGGRHEAVCTYVAPDQATADAMLATEVKSRLAGDDPADFIVVPSQDQSAGPGARSPDQPPAEVTHQQVERPLGAGMPTPVVPPPTPPVEVHHPHGDLGAVPEHPHEAPKTSPSHREMVLEQEAEASKSAAERQHPDVHVRPKHK